jgi:hypothetical protein
MKLLIIVLLILAGSTSFSQQPPVPVTSKNNFRAAVVKKNITPDKPQWLRGYNPRISTGIHDSIYHRIVVLDDGQTLFVLVSTDICVFSPVFYDDVAACEQLTHSTGNVTLKTDKFIVETRQHPELELPQDMHDYARTTASGEKLIRLPVRVLRINDDIAIWSAPVELFCEISNAVRNSSPYPFTFYFGYTNGVMGYLVSENEYQHEGYEPAVSPFTPRAGNDLTNAVISYLQEK